MQAQRVFAAMPTPVPTSQRSRAIIGSADHNPAMSRQVHDPESRLWSMVLLGIYQDIVKGGIFSDAYIAATENMVELEGIASSLGHRSGFIKELLGKALGESKAFRAKERERTSR